MGSINGRAAHLLGQSQEVVITDVVIAPEVFIQVVDNAAGIPTTGGCLRIVDRLRGRAIFSPLTPQAARAIAGHLLTYADQAMTVGGADGSASVHE